MINSPGAVSIHPHFDRSAGRIGHTRLLQPQTNGSLRGEGRLLMRRASENIFRTTGAKNQHSADWLQNVSVSYMLLAIEN